jgi:hypothetical protein
MDFLTTEEIEELALTPEQISGLTPKYENKVATIKKEMDGKANDNAEAILNGAIAKVIDLTKVTRNQGEKVADYLQRSSDTFLSNKKTELETAKADYDKKIAEFKGDDATKAELEKAKQDYDAVLQKYADYDDLKAKAEKFEPLETEYKTMKLQVAFQGVKPSFPDTVNQYEVKAKWDEFVKEVQTIYNIEIVDGEARAISKENVHINKKLSELVEQDKNITELLQGRQQQGTGHKTGKDKTIDGVPFAIPENATNEDISKLVNEYLDKQGVLKLAPNRASLFAEMYSKIKQAK